MKDKSHDHLIRHLTKFNMFIKKILKVDIEGTYLNIIKTRYDKPTANIILNSEMLKAFPLRSRTMSNLPFLVNIVLEVFV